MGSLVEAHSLQTAASLNGLRGRVVGAQDGRLLVDFEAAPGTTKALKPANLKRVDEADGGNPPDRDLPPSLSPLSDSETPAWQAAQPQWTASSWSSWRSQWSQPSTWGSGWTERGAAAERSYDPAHKAARAEERKALRTLHEAAGPGPQPSMSVLPIIEARRSSLT